MIKYFNKIRLKLGIDKAIFWSIISKGVAVIRSPISIYFIIKYLTPVEQGIWYTFINLGALAVFAELGFTSIITQFVSHEYAKLKEYKGKIYGDIKHLERLIGLIRFSLKIYLLVILFAIFILFIVGFFYFRHDDKTIYFVWMFYSIVGGLVLLAGLFQSIFQGLDKVKEIQINSIIMAVFSSVLTWTMLILGFKIWALALGNFCGLILAFLLLYNIGNRFWKQVLHFKIKLKYNFIKETIPLQGKYAISWICGYFIFSLYVPATFKFVGTIQAGQLGITLSIIMALSSISNSWISTKIPKFNIFVSNKNKRALDDLFKISIIQAIIIQFILTCSVIFGLLILPSLSDTISSRFLSLSTILPLLIVQLGYTVISALATYLRAFKEEPFVWVSILLSLLIVLCVLTFMKYTNLTFFFWIIALIYWLIILPLSFVIFKNKRSLYVSKYFA